MATILILEDETFVREMLALSSRADGYTLLEASTVVEAQQVLSSHSIDALVADVVLPGGGNGIAFALALVESQPKVRVLFMSGWPLRDMYDKPLSQMPPGSFALLQKPIGNRELLQEIRTLLGDARRGAG